MNAATEARRIKTVTVNKVIYPSTDEEKIKRGVVTADNKPKPSHRPLSLGVKHILRNLEVYNLEHDCDLCGGSNKSITVVLIEDTSTGETFRAAGDCLDYHFNEDIKNLEAGSKGLRLLLDMISELMGHYAEDTASAIDYALEHFDQLISFSCVAVDEAKEVLAEVRDNPYGATEGRLDEKLNAVRLLINLQRDARAQPELFKARWEAARAHPYSSEVGVNLDSLETILFRMSELELEQVVGLDELLRILRNHPPELKNGVPPWNSANKVTYRHELEVHYIEEANRPPSQSSERYDMQNDHLLVDELVKEARTFPIRMYVTSPEKLYVEDFELGDYAHCEVTVGAVIHYVDLGKEGESNFLYTRGIMVWRPDPWYDAYPLWHRYGKEKLERLEPLTTNLEAGLTGQGSNSNNTIKESSLTVFQRDRARVRAEQRAKEEAFIKAELPKYTPRVKRNEVEQLKAKLREIFQAELQGRWADAARVKRDLPQPVHEANGRSGKKPNDLVSTIENALKLGGTDKF